MPITMTIRLNAELKARLDHFANETHQSKSFLIREAIDHFITTNEWQIQEIKRAVIEADSGKFSSQKTVKSVLAKWDVNVS